MQTIFHTAKITFLTWFRDKTFLGILLAGVLMVLTSTFLHEMTVGDKSKIVIDLGLAVILYFGVFMCLFTIVSPLKDRSLYMILSKPIQRANWVLGNYLGYCAILLLNTLFLFGVMMVIAGALGREFTYQIPLAVYLIYLELAFMACVILAFSILMNSTALARILSLMVFITAHLIEEADFLLQSAKNELMSQVFTVLSWAFPNFIHFDARTEAVHQLAIPLDKVGYGTLYMLAYCTLIMLISTSVFAKTDL